MKLITATIRMFLFIAVGLLFVVTVYLFLENAELQKELAEAQKLPSIRDVQLRIGATVDGQLGPETQAKWERKYIDERILRFFK